MNRLFFLFFLFVTSLHAADLLVSIPPHKNLAEKISGGTLEVVLLLPPGASPHFYEPSSKQLLDASQAKVWFQVGEGFEKKASQALQSRMEIVDLRQGIEMIEDPSHKHCSHDCFDPHTWLSPKNGIIQAKAIANKLIELYPENSDLYRKNLEKTVQELQQLDLEIAKILAPIKGKTILVSHPAYGYLGRDYGFSQLSIEFEGRDPSPRQLTELLNQARKLGIHTVFIQAQHSSKGAKLVAGNLGAEIITLDPLGENYLQNLLHISQSLAR